MTQHPAWFRALGAVACWLALLAGGDDFNLARAVLPLPAPAPDSPLPLDDPNTDFTRSSEPRSPTAANLGGAGPAPPAGLRPARLALSPPAPSPARGRPLRAGSNAPLRC
jgi:hypothetical protein